MTHSDVDNLVLGVWHTDKENQENGDFGYYTNKRKSKNPQLKTGTMIWLIVFSLELRDNVH